MGKGALSDDRSACVVLGCSRGRGVNVYYILGIQTGRHPFPIQEFFPMVLGNSLFPRSMLMARPRNEVARLKVLYAPVTEEEQREVHAGAGLRGVPVGEFVRLAALEAARKLVGRVSRAGGRLPKSLPAKR